MPELLNQSLFLRACRRETVDRTPVWLMRQAGRYMKSYRDLRRKVSMLELCKDSDLSAEVTVDAVRQTGVDAAILFSDLLLILEPLGFDLDYQEHGGPKICPALNSASQVTHLRELDVEKSMGFVLHAAKKVREALPQNIPLIGFAGAPFTLAAYLIEGGVSRSFAATKKFFHEQPKAWNTLLSRLAHDAAIFLNAQVSAGAQAVQVFDSWVGCLSPSDYRTYVLPHTRKLFRNLEPDIPVIHFGTGTASLLELMKESMQPLEGRNPIVVGLDWRVGLKNAWDRLGHRVSVMGNLDPAILLSDRSVIRKEVKCILKEAAGRAGHIFNLGHGVLPETPLENVQFLVRAVKELSRRD